MTFPPQQNPFGPGSGSDPFGGAPGAQYPQYGPGAAYGQPPVPGPPMMSPGRPPSGPGRVIAVVAAAVAVVVAAVSLTVWLVRKPGDNSATPAVVPAAAPSAVDLAALLPDQEQIRQLVGVDDLTLNQAYTELTTASTVSYNPPDCGTVMGFLHPGVLDPAAVRGVYQREFISHKTYPVYPAVAAYADAAAARSAMQGLLAKWRSCGAAPFTSTYNGFDLEYRVSPPADAGDGISTVAVAPKSGLLSNDVAMAAKSNILVLVRASPRTPNPDVVVATVKAVLDRIPG